MAKINGNEIKPNMVIEYNGSVWRAMKCSHVKPGKGGAFNQVEMRNLFNGSKANERFRANETVERVRLEQKDFQFLYDAGEAMPSWIRNHSSKSSFKKTLSVMMAIFYRTG